MASNIEEIFQTSPEAMRKSSKSTDNPQIVRHTSTASSPSGGSMEKDDEPLFKPGDVLECATKNSDETIVGTVLCYDRQLGVLVLREEAKTRTTMRFLNMSHVLNITKKQPAPEGYIPDLPDNSEAAEQRLKKNEAEKRAIFIDEVPREAIDIFVVLKKICDDVVWQGKNIKVFGQVLIKEPYDLDSVEPLDSSSKTSQAIERVKKIMSSRRATSDPPPDLTS